MIKYNNTNNASTTLTAWISASSTTLIVENGDILPTAPFLLTLEHFDNEKVTVREIVKCIAKVGTILTIQRGAWTCVQDDSASTKEQGNSAHSFSVGDCASIYWTSEQVQDIQNEIEKKLNIDDFQAWTYVYGATSTWTDAYSITIPWTLTSYAVGQVFRFMADVDNEWNATLNINGLWAVEIRKNHDKILDNGDIEAGQIVEVAYDWTYFQMDSQVATVVDVASLWNTQYKTWVAGEDLEVWDLCCLVDFENDYFEMKLFWTTESSVEYEVIGNGWNDNSITLWLWRRGNSSWEDLVVELLDGETVIASSQITRSWLTEDTTVETVCSWWENIETEKGKSYTLRLRTYDNSVDVDKGFYYNNNNQNICDWFTSTGRYGVVRDLVEWDNSYSGEVYLYCWYNNSQSYSNWWKVTLIWTNNVVEYSWSGDKRGAGAVTRKINDWNSETVWSGNEWVYIRIPDDNYTKITFAKNNIYWWGAQLSRASRKPNNTTTLNIKANNLNSELLFKWSWRSLFVNTTTVGKWETTIWECWWISNIFVWQNYAYKYTSDKALWYFENKKLKYKPKYYQPLPIQNTNFFLRKDAIMVCSFGGNNNASSYTLKRSWDTYRNFSFNGNWYGVSTTEYVEWRLEWWHTYQIDFNPNLIKEFYYVD